MTFVYRTIPEVSLDQILDFANRTFAAEAVARIEAKWWLTGGSTDTSLAVDVATDQVAGMVVGIPSFWITQDDSEHPVVSICGWYVAPDYAGFGLGRKLVESLETRFAAMNAFSISDAAIQAFSRLGWKGPFQSELLLMPLPRLGRTRKLRDGFSLRSFRVVGADLPRDLADMLDNLEASMPPGRVRRRRTSADWRAHLGIWPKRVQKFHVVLRQNIPVGAFVIRATDDEAGRLYRLARLHYVTDVVCIDDSAALSFLAENVATAAPLTAGALLLCTSDKVVSSAIISNGWLSKTSPGIGQKLANKAPQFMLGGLLGQADGASLGFTFTDSDVDLNI